jgi:hypothetical protein
MMFIHFTTKESDIRSENQVMMVGQSDSYWQK